MLYRVSEHGYSGQSFHEYCDDKGPTLVIIKSSGGWIFGGYTTQSWSGWCIYYAIIYWLLIGCKNDDKAFIFTLKNPHGVEPVRYMKRKESEYAIKCDPKCGPIFGNDDGSDIHIGDKCNTENSCYIKNNGIYGYECNSEHKEFLFVNSTGTDGRNEF